MIPWQRSTVATELDVARRIYSRTPMASQQLSASRAGGVLGGQSGNLAMRYGTAIADSADGWVNVHLDLAESESDYVVCICDSPISKGQRVSVLVTDSGQLKAIPIGDNIFNAAVDYVDKANSDLAIQIRDDIDEAVSAVDAEMEAWKADHKLTDDDIQHSIETSVSQATETWEGKLSSVEGNIETNYALKTEVTQGIDGLRTEISETYATSEGVSNQIDTAIEAASGEISSTVEQNVKDSIGNTYATKTELSQTSSSLQLNITQATNKANSAASDASEALDAANEVSSYFTFDSTGLEVGREGNDSSVKMGSNGTFQVLDNGTAVTVMGTNSNGAYISTTNPTFQVQSYNGNAVATFGNDRINLSAMNGIWSTPSDMSLTYNSTNSQVASARVLYASSSGTSGSVRLNDSASRYWMITIFYRNGSNRCGSVNICAPSGGTISGSDSRFATIDMVTGNGSSFYMLSEIVNTSGRYIERSSARQLTATGNTHTNSAATIYIYAVIGWIC